MKLGKHKSLTLVIAGIVSCALSGCNNNSSDGNNSNNGKVCSPLTGKESGIDIGRISKDRCLPGSNPLQDQQWYLLNTGQDAYSQSHGVAGYDLNLWWAHRTNVLGQGINVAVIDDGLAIHHPDLVDNITAGSINILDGSNDPTPTTPDDAHGTSIAGIIAAVDNSIGVKGVAPSAKMMAFNYLDPESDQLLKDLLLAYSADSRVFNQSFGPSLVKPLSTINLNLQAVEGKLAERTLNDRAAFIKAAGNGFNSVGSTLGNSYYCLLYTSPSPRDGLLSRMPSSA